MNDQILDVATVPQQDQSASECETRQVNASIA
jgi:hypothetical protein